MQALNFAPKALEALRQYDQTATGLARVGLSYVAEKLERAQVFVLPDYGQLLDRGRPRHEIPGQFFKPPFPVVALEYTAAGPGRDAGVYTEARSSKRIALAWEWEDDLPTAITRLLPLPRLGPGVAVLPIPFYDQPGMWMPLSAAMHLPYEGAFAPDAPPMPHHAAMQALGQIPKGGIPVRTSAIPILPEAIMGAFERLGPAGAMDMIAADAMDELNAYIDLTSALACSNVRTERHAAPERLNRNRAAAGRYPLRDFHTLMLNGHDGDGGHATSVGAMRSHLRRGHIRRLRHLGPDRITWVNATMVRGSSRGFVDKAYDMRRADNARS